MCIIKPSAHTALPLPLLNQQHDIRIFQMHSGNANRSVTAQTHVGPVAVLPQNMELHLAVWPVAALQPCGMRTTHPRHERRHSDA